MKIKIDQWVLVPSPNLNGANNYKMLPSFLFIGFLNFYLFWLDFLFASTIYL